MAKKSTSSSSETGSGSGEGDGTGTEYEESDLIPITLFNPKFKVEKLAISTPANGETYVVGETITYEITVTNIGNQDVTDINVVDELTGLNETVAVIEVGKSISYITQYTVKDADGDAGTILNVVKVTGKTPDPDVIIGYETEQVVNTLPDEEEEYEEETTNVSSETSDPACMGLLMVLEIISLCGIASAVRLMKRKEE